MAQEFQTAAEFVLNLKQIMLAMGGFVVRLLWLWESPIAWLRIIAGLIFLMGGLYFNQEWTPRDYQSVSAALIGLFTNNIIAGLFRWWKVNEDGLMDKTRQWWHSDKKEG